MQTDSALTLTTSANRSPGNSTAGELQQEMEHRYAGEEPSGGSTDVDRAWRRTEEWFSYEVTNVGGRGTTLRIIHAQDGWAWPFDVVDNGQMLQKVGLSGSRTLGSATVTVTLPQSVLLSAAGEKHLVNLPGDKISYYIPTSTALFPAAGSTEQATG